MTKLFVIGNGFDLAHGLKTSYEDFRNYLLLEYPEIQMDSLVLPNETPLPNGGISYNDQEVLSMLFYLINNAEKNDEKWCDIENSLGYLDFSDAFDWLGEIRDKDGGIDFWKTSTRNEDISSQLVIPTIKIQKFFWEWINSITIYSATPKEDFMKLLNKGDQFLTFNYTETLEVVYDIHPADICHIHGKQNEEIFFGHGNSEDYYDSYMQSNIGSQDSLKKIDDQLRKDTYTALERKMGFFENLNSVEITAVYSYGFSFNQVDTIYIKEISKRINTENVTWYFNNFDIPNMGKYIRILKDCGFKGEFNTYHIN